jgi:hypothetical protein
MTLPFENVSEKDDQLNEITPEIIEEFRKKKIVLIIWCMIIVWRNSQNFAAPWTICLNCLRLF